MQALREALDACPDAVVREAVLHVAPNLLGGRTALAYVVCRTVRERAARERHLRRVARALGRPLGLLRFSISPSFVGVMHPQST